jgi:ankyrin repeat protein
MAASSDTPASVQALLAAGAEVMARDKDGSTPLHYAAKCIYGCKRGAKQALLDAGADAKAKNKEGKTPWDLVQENDKLKGTKDYWALNDAQYN